MSKWKTSVMTKRRKCRVRCKKKKSLWKDENIRNGGMPIIIE